MKDFLSGVADLMEHGHGLEKEERRLDDEIKAAGMDPDAYAAHMRVFLDEKLAQRPRRPGWLESLAEALRPRKAWAVAGALAAVFMGLWVFRGNNAAMAAEVLAQGAQRLADLGSIRMKARMRTLPRDNFEMIGLDYDFVDIGMWKRYGTPGQWRVEKPGRVVVMDGKGTTLWIKPDEALRAGVETGLVDWLRPLLDIQKVLHHEVDLAARQGSRLSMRPAQGAPDELEVTVEAKAQGDYANGYAKNQSIMESDNRRVYRFDAKTNRLKGLRVFVHSGRKDVLVFELTDIQYNPDLEDSLFALQLPKDVAWITEAQKLADNDRYQKMGPGEMTKAFFQACADKDWDELAKFSQIAARKSFQEAFGGLQIVSLGKPFKSGLYYGWFVPYEIRLPSGEVRKGDLAVRDDNPGQRFVLDGGL